MKIVVFEFEEWQRPYFRELEETCSVIYDPSPLQGDLLPAYKDADIITTFIKSKLSGSVLGEFQDLKLIAARSTGFDHIDHPACQENKISVCNVPAYGDNTIAEYVFALLLSLSRKIPVTLQRTRAENFSRDGLQGFDLCGKTIGIIGTGSIGKYVAKIAKGFGMNILAYDLYPDNKFAQELGFSYCSLEEVLQQSDILSLHIPANEGTRNLIAATEFNKMKDGAILINTARGEVVHQEDLIAALKAGKISAAALDVFPNEAEFFKIAPHQTSNKILANNHILLHMPNVIITPHNAYNTQEAVTRIVEITIDNIKNFIANQPTNIVL